MSDRQTAVTKQETLAALRKPGELYVVMSAVTKLPFVKCDEETFDDEIFLYYRVEDAKDKAKELLDQRYLTAVAKLEDRQLLAFYTSLYTMGVNCLAVNHGTDTQISIQLQDLVVRKDPSGLPEGKKVIENPALHLTAIYFMQEMRRQEKPQPTGELKDLQEELLAHYSKASFIIAMQEDKQVPVLKLKMAMSISLFLRISWNSGNLRTGKSCVQWLSRRRRYRISWQGIPGALWSTRSG